MYTPPLRHDSSIFHILRLLNGVYTAAMEELNVTQCCYGRRVSDWWLLKAWSRKALLHDTRFYYSED